MHVLPLHSDLATRLRQWLAKREQRADGQRVVLAFDRAANVKPERQFPGTWAAKAATMLRRDLKTAKIPYATDSGFADFHSLRHTFISNLVAVGVHPKLAQQLARHSTITLTMDRYSHVGLLDMSTALESLPAATTPESQPMQATGTTDQHAEDFSCTKSCTRSAEITSSQPFSTVAESSETHLSRPTKKPRFPAEYEAFSESNTAQIQEASVGVEPTRDGFAIRCLSHLATTPNAGAESSCHRKVGQGGS